MYLEAVFGRTAPQGRRHNAATAAGPLAGLLFGVPLPAQRLRTKQRQVVLWVASPMDIPATRTKQQCLHTVALILRFSFGPPAVDEPSSTVTTGKRSCVALPLFLITSRQRLYSL